MLLAIIIMAAAMILILIFIVCYNKLVRQKIMVEEAFSTMDVYLRKRFDLIPNLVETVKEYARHEEAALSQITSLRNRSYSNMSAEEKFANSEAISQAVPKVMALAESYPDLKANHNFMELGAQLEKVENDIANARKYYNGAVKKYNTTVQTIPANIVAGLFHFQNKPMFQVDSEQERKNVQVKF